MQRDTTLVISTTNTRVEISAPVALLETGETSRVVAFVRELGYEVPNSAMLSRNESSFILHETPVFG